MTDLKNLQSPLGAEIIIDGRRYVSFGGSSYLGMASNAVVREAGAAAFQAYGAGTPIPRDHRLATSPHLDVESEAAKYFDAPAALYLGGGYLFGLIAISAYKDKFDAVFFDELAHYSLKDAIAASGLKSWAFRHGDPEDLSAKLKEHLRPRDRPLVATDGMFSTFGEIASLDALAQAIAPYDGRLLVDESHSFGVLGPMGRGASELHQIPASQVLRGGSLGKAFGACGGIVPASEAEVAAFRATPAGRGAGVGPAAGAAASAASLKYVREHPEVLQRLRSNVSYLKPRLRAMGLEIRDSIAPVASFATGSNESMSNLKSRLMDEGIFVYHTTYIGAGAGGAIRCSIFADHTKEHMDLLIAALRRLL